MRETLITHASALIARRGVDGVSIADIAHSAGVSKANVMHHFGSKDGLYAACLAAIDARLGEYVEEATNREQLAAALAAWAHSHPDDVRVMAYGLLRLPERPGRWAISEPVLRMTEIVGGDDPLADAVDLLGVVTYREMARPLAEQHAELMAERNETPPR